MTMQAMTMTVQLPTELYQRLKYRAEQAQHSVETELVETVATALPSEDELPPELAEAVAQLALLDDEALQRMVRRPFPPEKAAQLEALHLKRQDAGLSQAEAQTAAKLARDYEHALFLRAQAMALLLQRGYDVATMLEQP